MNRDQQLKEILEDPKKVRAVLAYSGMWGDQFITVYPDPGPNPVGVEFFTGKDDWHGEEAEDHAHITWKEIDEALKMTDEEILKGLRYDDDPMFNALYWRINGWMDPGLP